MKPEALLQQLEHAAEQLGIRVSYEQLQSSVVTGGLCKVKGTYRVIIDKRASAEERVNTLAGALAQFPERLAELAMPAKVRALLRLHEPAARRSSSAA